MDSYYPMDIPSSDDSETWPQSWISPNDCVNPFKCHFVLPHGRGAVNPKKERRLI
jgi:hypothetical protein